MREYESQMEKCVAAEERKKEQFLEERLRKDEADKQQADYKEEESRKRKIEMWHSQYRQELKDQI